MLLFDVNELVFNPDVWGTVSDWITVFATAGPVIYLTKKLTARADSLTIDLNRYRLYVMPKFRIDVTIANEHMEPITSFTDLVDGILVRTGFTLGVTNKQPAMCFMIEYPAPETGWILEGDPMGEPINILPSDDDFRFFISKEIKGVTNKASIREDFTFSITFKDLFGSGYLQTANYSLYQNVEKLTVTSCDLPSPDQKK